MKKTYEKPKIMFESFTLTSNIASGCEILIGNQSRNTCGYEGSAPGVILFTDAVSGCNYKLIDSANNGFCYHVPIETNNLFNS